MMEPLIGSKDEAPDGTFQVILSLQ